MHQHMASGKYTCEDDLLRSAFRALTEEEEDLAAVQQAIYEWQAGDEGVPLDEACEAIRSRFPFMSS